MTIYQYQYLIKAIQDDARRAGERDRLLLEARRARRARRQRLVPAAPARRLEQLDSPQGRRANEVSTLKQHIDGDIVIADSFQFVRTLIEHDLVDELDAGHVGDVSSGAAETPL